ncbi:hypothetical protein [Sphingomonas colocasiae]|uniref:DUF983 domain-containing protein n=1 Tax=Sphingomonas colocasiae TaxID=1848973 RepID=A0ABS7PUX4_9SPHN|nr:hypothetical protein [Sphingomonas colocasiae]MBY8825073.1 hypothetical protein [Sphingomonas colocasiae]
MSPYVRAWAYVAIVASLLLGASIWGDGGVPPAVLPYLVVLFPLHVGLTAVFFKCRACGTSVFAHRPGMFGPFTPWPHRHCRKCGNDNHAG